MSTVRSIRGRQTWQDVFPFIASVRFADNTKVWQAEIGTAKFPSLGEYLAHAVTWRIKWAFVKWTSYDPNAKGVIGWLVTPAGKRWLPTSMTDLVERGGIKKPVRQSNWNSNTLPAQQEWVDASGTAGMVAGWSSFNEVDDVGELTLHMCFETDGRHM